MLSNRQEMWVGNTKVLAGLDKKNNRIHLLDLDDMTSLTNALSKEFCRIVLDKVHPKRKVTESECEFICYHTDGMITKFIVDQADFVFVSPSHEVVDGEFKKEMFYIYGAI